MLVQREAELLSSADQCRTILEQQLADMRSANSSAQQELAQAREEARTLQQQFREKVSVCVCVSTSPLIRLLCSVLCRRVSCWHSRLHPPRTKRPPSLSLQNCRACERLWRRGRVNTELSWRPCRVGASDRICTVEPLYVHVYINTHTARQPPAGDEPAEDQSEGAGGGGGGPAERTWGGGSPVV